MVRRIAGHWQVIVAPLLVPALVGVTPAGAQPSDGYILIQEPAAWRGEASRGIIIREKHSIRVVGEASHPSGIYRVLIDGTEASLDPQPNNVLGFVGYANPEATTDRVEVVAYPRDGEPIIKTYAYDLQVAETAYDDPDEAWDLGGDFDGERYAVVIGISHYLDPSITSLEYADDDAQLFYDFLLSENAGLGGFMPDHVLFLKNEAADTRSISRALSGFLRRVSERDVVVFYFAGHGAPDPYARDEYYFLTYDTEGSDIAGTAYPMSEVYARIGRLRARDIVVIADACHSAAVTSHFASRAITNNDINGAFLERLQTTAAGKLIFTAAETNQLSFEDVRWGGGHGVFTYHLVEGLRGAADDDGDRIVTLHEMVEYARRQVGVATEQLQIPAISGQFNRAWPMAMVPVETVAQLDPPPVEVPVEVPPDPVLEDPPVEDPRPEEPPLNPVTRGDVDLMSAGWAFTHSFIIPGSGQMRTGHGFRGFLVLAGVGGAAGYVYATRELHQQCRIVPNPTCPPGDVEGTTLKFPYLIPAAAAAGGLVFIGALDALIGAKGVNARRLRDAGVTDSQDMALRVLPSEPVLNSRPGDVRLLELRFR